MWPRFGIKIGNSTVCIAATKDDGKIEVIANKQGDRVSDACLLWQDNEIEVGITAKQKMPSKLLQTVANSFQLFQTNLTDEQECDAMKLITCNYNKTTKKFDLIDSDGKEKPLTPYEVCVEFFKASYELAKHYNSSQENPLVVLSIPDYYSYDCWLNLSKAAEESGFHVAQIITEPTAAVLAYELGENSLINNNIDNNIYHNDQNGDQNINDDTKIILFIKSGGICSSFTLYEIKNGLYNVIDTAGPYYIGGKQITDCIIEFITNEFYKKYKLNVNESRRSISKIRIAADNCKHLLTTLQSTHIYIDSLMDGIDFNIQMSRARFESLIQSVLNEFLTILNTSLENINKNNRNIDEIVLAGATLKIPKIQSMISQRFPNANLNMKISTDEVVAYGCARQTKFLLNPNDKDLNLNTKLTIIDNNIYLWLNNNNKKILLFKKGTIIPNIIKFDYNINDENGLNHHNDNDDDDLNNKENNDDDDDDDDTNKLIFTIEVNNVIKKIKLIDIKPYINNLLHIEAEIKLNNDGNLPIINLRSI